jgi:formylglycine-generating enzyme required for sulfatase activity
VKVQLAEGKKTQATVKLEQGSKDMATIPAGCFQMGSIDGEADEKPVHKVCLSAFNMDKTEVTQGAYTAVIGSNPSYFSSCGDNCPVEQVDWSQAKAYCEQVGKRLPTEAEFEYANRAGSTTKYQCGNDESCLDRIAWYKANSNSQTHPVGQKQPNAWGLYDMTGNVWEWTSDWYGNYDQGSGKDPKGEASGSDRVDRGGSWFSDAQDLRSALRYSIGPAFRNINLGFRCAL